MIKDVEVIYIQDAAIWQRGNIRRTSELTKMIGYEGAKVIFKKSYPRGTPTFDIWREIRAKGIDAFFNIFYPAVLDQTKTHDVLPDNANPANYRTLKAPDGSTKWITKNVDAKSIAVPDDYWWNNATGKYVMTPDAYRRRIGDMSMGVTDDASGNVMYPSMEGIQFLDRVQEANHGKMIEFVLFIYPDRYDEEIRAMFLLRITFWD